MSIKQGEYLRKLRIERELSQEAACGGYGTKQAVHIKMGAGGIHS